MIDQIKDTLKQYFKLNEARGIFISCFDKNNTLVLSHGVISTNKSLGKVIDMLYSNLIKPHAKNISTIVCDVVLSAEQITNSADLTNRENGEYGFSVSTIDYSKSGIILPGTQGIDSPKKLLQIIKEKNDITGNVIIHRFKSQKIVITKI